MANIRDGELPVPVAFVTIVSIQELSTLPGTSAPGITSKTSATLKEPNMIASMALNSQSLT